jgi:hypothetical protein
MLICPFYQIGMCMCRPNGGSLESAVSAAPCLLCVPAVTLCGIAGFSRVVSAALTPATSEFRSESAIPRILASAFVNTAFAETLRARSGVQNWSRPRNSICRLAAPSTMLLIRPTLPGTEMFEAGK